MSAPAIVTEDSRGSGYLGSGSIEFSQGDGHTATLACSERLANSYFVSPHRGHAIAASRLLRCPRHTARHHRNAASCRSLRRPETPSFKTTVIVTMLIEVSYGRLDARLGHHAATTHAIIPLSATAYQRSPIKSFAITCYLSFVRPGFELFQDLISTGAFNP